VSPCLKWLLKWSEATLDSRNGFAILSVLKYGVLKGCIVQGISFDGSKVIMFLCSY
jgi:hypothetical protein